MEHYIKVGIKWGEPIWILEFLSLYMASNFVELQFAPLVHNKSLLFNVGFNNSWQEINNNSKRGCVLGTFY
jgi:hypothetical protein